MTARVCSVEGCGRPYKRRGLCHTHAERAAYHGELPPLPKATALERFMAKVSPCPLTGCWWWTGGEESSGYGRFNVALGEQERSHRAAWLLFRGLIPPGMEVCHSCDNRACVNPAHLFLGTNAENIADMVAKERHATGERQASAKLTDAAVEEIRAAYRAGGVTQRELADRFGVCHQVIGKAIQGRTWRHVEGA